MKGKGSLAHNNREFIADNVDSDRTKYNIYYKQESLETAYKNCFAEAIENYNAKQKRKDRRIAGVKGYMEQIKNSGNGEKLFYETVVQVGNIYDSAIGTEQGELCKTILDEYMKEFEERNPNLYVFNAVMHNDECTPHLHIDYIPLGREYKKGMAVKNSLDRALKQQGIDGKANKFNSLAKHRKVGTGSRYEPPRSGASCRNGLT
ncbi:MAG: plasmid recombination protein [Clostridiales bacterium]|nr:plasmid recombination protein [Clostridiales bacterium]